MGGPDLSGELWKESIRVCTVQPLLSLGNIDVNLSRSLDLVDGSAGEDVDLIVLPEVFATGFDYTNMEEHTGRSHEVLKVIGSRARELSAYIMFTQMVKEGPHHLNRCYVIGPDGNEITHYDKTHLFSRAGEDEHFTQGSETTYFEIKGARIAPLICYELRFPELSRKLVLEGAHVLVYMAQWPRFRIFQWDALLMSRAIENQCYVVASGSFGPHGNETMGGHSRVISPFGNVLVDLGEGPGKGCAALDPSELQKFRKKIPVLGERRPDLYH